MVGCGSEFCNVSPKREILLPKHPDRAIKKKVHLADIAKKLIEDIQRYVAARQTHTSTVTRQMSNLSLMSDTEDSISPC